MSYRPRLLMCYHSAKFGGVERQILDIITGLSRDFEITVVCPEGPLVKEYLRAGAMRHIDLRPRIEFDFLYSLKIFKLVREEKIEIVHSHELLTGSLATFGAWLARCKKRIYHVHTPFSQWKYSRIKKIPALIINTFVNAVVGNIFATNVIALTPSIKDIRIKREFICPPKITIIPNGVDLSYVRFTEKGRGDMRRRWGIVNNTIIIGNISRFTEEKGHETLIRAFASLTKAGSSPKGMIPLKLVLAGGGALLKDMKELVKSLGLEGEVIFTGKFEEKTKSSILSSFDIFVFPTHAEGFGIVLIEAMAVGLPTIVSDLPVLRDVGGGAIKYTPVGDVQALSGAIREMTESRDSWKKISTDAREQAQNYSIESFWKSYRRLYS